MDTVADLQNENAQLKARLQQQTQTLEQRNEYIRRLEEWVAQLRHKQFAPSSEKAAPDQFGLFNEAEEDAEAEDSASVEDTDTVPVAPINAQSARA